MFETSVITSGSSMSLFPGSIKSKREQNREKLLIGISCLLLACEGPFTQSVAAMPSIT